MQLQRFVRISPFPKGTIKSTTRRQMKLLHSVHISPYHFPRYVNIDHPSANVTVAFCSNILYHFCRESLPFISARTHEMHKIYLFGRLELLIVDITSPPHFPRTDGTPRTHRMSNSRSRHLASS